MSAEPPGGPQEVPLRGPQPVSGKPLGPEPPVVPGHERPLNPPASTASGWQPAPQLPPPPQPLAQPQLSPPQPFAQSPGLDVPPKQFVYVRMQQHRGNTILALGISGVMMAVIGGIVAVTLYCCPPVWALPLASLGLSIPAWVMAQRDLAEMRANRMDPAGRDTTIAGMIAGIVGVCLIALGMLLILALVLLMMIGVAASSRLPNQP